MAAQRTQPATTKAAEAMAKAVGARMGELGLTQTDLAERSGVSALSTTSSPAGCCYASRAC